MLLFPDGHLGFESVDQVCARCECLGTMDCTDGDDNGWVADLEVADTMLHGDRQDVVLIGSLLGTPGKQVQSAGMLGVVERDDLGAMVAVAYGADKQRNATDRRARDQADRPIDVKRRLADTDLTNL
jgi:hypothetical protein